VPYRDIEQQRRAKRESAARARARAAQTAHRALAPGSTSVNVEPDVEPTVAAILPPLTPPSAADLDYAARILGIVPLRGDTPEKVLMRVKTAWQRLVRVVEG
jgi:hypothetical protein